jgi:hypothetical protein
MAEHPLLAAPGARGNGFISFDQKSFEATMRMLKSADAELYKSLRRKMLAQGTKIKKAQQDAVRGLDVKGVRGGGGKVRSVFAARVTAENALTGTLSKTQIRRANRATSLRSAAAGAVGVEVRERPTARVRRVGVSINLKSSRMPPGQGRLPKHMNYGRWRHPVFGHRDAQWVTQTAKEQGWFDGTFKSMKDDSLRAIDAAITEAWANLH